MDQQRFILAMVLSAGVILVWQMFFAPEPPKPDPTKKKGQKTAEESPGEEPTEGDTTAGAEEDEAPQDTEKKADQKETADQKAESAAGDESIGEPVIEKAESERDVEVTSHVIESDQFRVELTNEAGVRVSSIKLLSPDQYQKRGDLLDAFPENPSYYPYRVSFSEDKIPIPDETTYDFVEDESQLRKDGETYKKLTYRYQDPKGRFRIDKVFTVSEKDPYVITLDVNVKNNLDDAKLSDAIVLDTFGYKDPNEETSFLNFRPNTVEGVCRMSEETQRSSIGDVEEALKYDESEVIWSATDTRYFMTAAVPENGGQSCSLEKVGEGYLRTRLSHDTFSVRPGETHTTQHKLFVGPKDVDILHEVGHHLSDSVNYGLFAFIARPLRWSLNFLQGYVVNWGLAIILLTIVIKLLTWPINMKAYRNMEDMKKIQPKLEKVREKYEDDRQRMTEETMKLFRENDVSPMGGCLPMLLQMPILYGLYVMIYNSVELYEASFMLWYTNLAAPDPYYVLPILMGVVMFVQQGMMGGAGANKQAQIMTKVMPVMFTAFMLFLPSGLVLYYSVNLMIGLGQQFYIRGLPFGDDEDETAKA